MAPENDHVRKGPWTENEDVQLVFYVNMFGDRRWDFIAKVSGLKRTGKSCRLRWVNYLHPGLKRGKMTPHEERLVLEFHAKWGNRWSRIARKLPGRTDNEIKNYWRTHMRKKAQEMKRASSPPSSSSYSSSSSSSSASSHVVPVVETDERSFYDTGGVLAPSSLISNKSCSSFDSINPIMEMKERKSYDVGELGMLIPREKKDKEEEKMEKVISMDDIWEDLALSGSNTLNSVHDFSTQTITSPIWKYCPDLLWGMEEEGEMIFPQMSDRSFAHYGLEGSNLTG